MVQFMCFILSVTLSLKVPLTKTVGFANSRDSDEMAHDELPCLSLHCFPSGLRILDMIKFRLFEILQA